ncbi:MAG: trypsin-like peptidase domain-containing protein [Acidobacteriia bacterium]|nr:trypsin-like peptidase domain-containing protein [Terriglobia bacterium]
MIPDIYKAVVRLTNTSSLGGGTSLGSGVIISPSGLVITNNHVIEDADFGTAFGDIVVETVETLNRPASEARPAELVIRNESYDLAVIRILDTPPCQFIDLLGAPPIDESWMESRVRVLGYPPLGGDTITVTRGIVSGFDESGNIKTDAEINPGNSGGAALDDLNTFLGIPTFIVAAAAGKLGFIVSTDRIKEWLRTVLRHGLPETSEELAAAFADSNLNISGDNLDQSTKYPRILSTFAAVETLLSRREFDEVIPHIEFILKKRPRSARAYKYLGNAFLGLERYPEAATQFRICLAYDPGDIPALGNLGLTLAHLDRHTEALQIFEQIIDSSDNPLELWAAYNNIGHLYETSGRPELSEAYRQKADELRVAAEERSSQYERPRDPENRIHRIADALVEADIMASFQKRVRREYSDLFSAAASLAGIAESLLTTAPQDPFQQTLRYFAASLTNSNSAVVLLCENGHGVDAVKLVRAMFESQITIKYLVKHPAELRDYLDFDAVSRWRRQQFYRSKHPDQYASFPESKISTVEREFAKVRKRFRGWNGKVRDRWCRHPMPEMAKRAGLADMYSLFYGYASALQNLDPMGLGMMIHGRSLDVQPAPTMAHIGIALEVGSMILLETLRDFSKACRVDNEDAFERVEENLAKAKIDLNDPVVGGLDDVIAYE